MSITIAGYNRIEAIYEGANTPNLSCFQRGRQTSVLIKTLKAEYPTLEELVV